MEDSGGYIAYETPPLWGRTRPHPPTRVSCRVVSRSRFVAISRAVTIHDSPRVLDRSTRATHSTDHDSTRPPTRRPRPADRPTACRGDDDDVPGTSHARARFVPATDDARERRSDGVRAHTGTLFTSTGETRDRTRGEDVERFEHDARQPRRAGDDRARARGDDGTRAMRETRDEGRGEDGWEWMRARDGANAVDERGGGETGDDGDAEVAIGDLSNPSRARARGTAADAGVGRGYGCVWGRTRVGVVVCGGVVCVAREVGVVGRGEWARRARRAIGRLTRLRFFFIRAGEQEQGDSMCASIGDGDARRRDGAEGTAQKEG